MIAVHSKTKYFVLLKMTKSDFFFSGKTRRSCFPGEGANIFFFGIYCGECARCQNPKVTTHSSYTYTYFYFFPKHKRSESWRAVRRKVWHRNNLKRFSCCWILHFSYSNSSFDRISLYRGHILKENFLPHLQLQEAIISPFYSLTAPVC